MKKYTIDVNESAQDRGSSECSPPHIRKEEPPKKSDSSFGILFLAILATFILFPESVDTVNDYYKQQKEHYQLEPKDRLSGEQKKNESREISTK